jgi:hypothetical protein
MAFIKTKSITALKATRQNFVQKPIRQHQTEWLEGEAQLFNYNFFYNVAEPLLPEWN